MGPRERKSTSFLKIHLLGTFSVSASVHTGPQMTSVQRYERQVESPHFAEKEVELSRCEVTCSLRHSWDSHFTEKDTEAQTGDHSHTGYEPPPSARRACELSLESRLQSPPQSPQKTQGERQQEECRYRAVSSGVRESLHAGEKRLKRGSCPSPGQQKTSRRGGGLEDEQN